MTYLASSTLNKAQSPLQFGFTRDVPCGTAAMLITETMAHYKDLKQPLHLVFMDASKAFDIVDHDCALNHLYDQGVNGDLWSLFNDLYTNITSSIKWNRTISEPFKELQGIRQGAISSTDIFKARANSCLKRLEDHPSSAHVGYNKLGAVMVADDHILSACSSKGAQSLLCEAELDAARERYSFSKQKTRCMTLSSGKDANDNHDLCLNGSKLEKSWHYQKNT